MAHLPIDKLKEGLHLAFLFWKQTQTAMADGKFDFADAIGYLDEILMVSAVAGTSKELLAQVLDIDVTERAELYEWAKGEFPADTPENVQKKVQAALDWLLTSIIAFAAFKPDNSRPVVEPSK